MSRTPRGLEERRNSNGRFGNGRTAASEAVARDRADTLDDEPDSSADIDELFEDYAAAVAEHEAAQVAATAALSRVRDAETALKVARRADITADYHAKRDVADATRTELEESFAKITELTEPDLDALHTTIDRYIKESQAVSAARRDANEANDEGWDSTDGRNDEDQTGDRLGAFEFAYDRLGVAIDHEQRIRHLETLRPMQSEGTGEGSEAHLDKNIAALRQGTLRIQRGEDPRAAGGMPCLHCYQPKNHQVDHREWRCVNNCG